MCLHASKHAGVLGRIFFLFWDSVEMNNINCYLIKNIQFCCSNDHLRLTVFHMSLRLFSRKKRWDCGSRAAKSLDAPDCRREKIIAWFHWKVFH